MNVRKELEETLKDIGDIKYHPDFLDDIADILNHSGRAEQFFKKFLTSLFYLNQHKENTHNVLSKNFEQLKEVENLYSMHINIPNYNVRVLYSFLPNGTILLHGFHERGGKKATDYTRAISIAEIRKADCSEEESL